MLWGYLFLGFGVVAGAVAAVKYKDPVLIPGGMMFPIVPAMMVARKYWTAGKVWDVVAMVASMVASAVVWMAIAVL